MVKTPHSLYGLPVAQVPYTHAKSHIDVVEALRAEWSPEFDPLVLIVVRTTDEGSGAFNGVEWLIGNHRIVVDAGHVLNEGGGGVLRDGKPMFNTIRLAQMRPSGRLRAETQVAVRVNTGFG